jgi:serine O-acetyltransferase
MMPKFRDLIYADLAAHSHRRGLKGLLVALVFSPGLLTVLLHRIAVRLYAGNKLSRLAGRLLWRFNTGRSGCFISLECCIGPGFELPHPTGVVIGDGVRIGAGVSIYQSVTLGRRNAFDAAYPELGDGVTLYAGAVVLGPVKLGNGVCVGANSVVTRSVVANATVVGIPARIIETSRG